MKERIAKRTLCVGLGAGVVLFFIYGLQPISFIGKAAGLTIAGILLGTPVEAGGLASVILGAAMVATIVLVGIMAVGTLSTIGWLAGAAVDAVRIGKEVRKPVESFR
jgi:hypothetical protein